MKLELNFELGSFILIMIALYLSVILLVFLDVANGFSLPLKIRSSPTTLTKRASSNDSNNSTGANTIKADVTGYFIEVRFTLGSDEEEIIARVDTLWADSFIIGGDEDTFTCAVSSGGANSTMTGSDAESSSDMSDCTEHGFFDINESRSFTRNESLNRVENNYSTESGYFGQDTFKYEASGLDSITIENFNFIVLDKPVRDISVLGLGVVDAQVTNDKLFNVTEDGSLYTYETLPFQMKRQGLMKRAMFSCYLGDTGLYEGSFDFGTVDITKYKGELHTFDLISDLGDTFPSYTIESKDIQVVNGSDKLSIAKGEKYKTTIDPAYGGPIFLPKDVLENLVDSTDIYEEDSLYYIPCESESDDMGNLTFSIGDFEISVPFNELSYKYYGEQVCNLEISEAENGYETVLTLPALRRAFMVFDQEDRTVSLAHFTNLTLQEHIQIDGSVDYESLKKDHQGADVSSSLSSSESTTQSEDDDSQDEESETPSGNAVSLTPLFNFLTALLFSLFV